MPHTKSKIGRDRAVLLGLLTLALFATPATSWWLGVSPPWYLPYLLWAGVIGLAAWHSSSTGGPEKGDDD
jgi:hypothetical protein